MGDYESGRVPLLPKIEWVSYSLQFIRFPLALLHVCKVKRVSLD
jgi:hypothetical protein